MNKISISYFKDPQNGPVIIEVSSWLEKTVIDSISQTTNLDIDLLMAHREYFEEDEQKRVRYIIDGLSSEKLAEVAHYAGQLFIAFYHHFNQNLN
jgi:hypothetical protein